MKKIILALATLALTGSVEAQNITLPAPKPTTSMTLMNALAARHSGRSFSDQAIPDAVLSQVLWAACGINRPESGKITAPSAINAQDIIVYVLRADGTYRYEPKAHELTMLSTTDLRQAVAGRQAFAATAPVSLLLVSDHSKFGGHQDGAQRMGAIDAGYVSENIALACAALGLENVPRMTMDTDELRKALNLNETFDLVLNQQIGYPTHE